MDLVGALSGREAGSEPGTELPRIQAAGMPLTPDGGHLAFLGKTSNSTEELIQAVKERKSAGCGCVKLIVSGGQLTPGSVPEHDTYSRGEIRAAVEAAHELGLPTAAHCLTTSSYVNAMEAGVDSVEHCACFRRNRRLGLLERCYEPDVMEAFRGDHRYFMIGISNNYHQLDQVREGVKPFCWNRKSGNVKYSAVWRTWECVLWWEQTPDADIPFLTKPGWRWSFYAGGAALHRRRRFTPPPWRAPGHWGTGISWGGWLPGMRRISLP